MGRTRPSKFITMALVFTGCLGTKTVEPVRDIGPPFRLDPPLKDLNTSCLTGTLNGCDVTASMEEGIKALTALHEKQMVEAEQALRDLSVLLNRADDVPMARVTAPQLDTSMWVDPDAKYPARLEVRVQGPRGLARMGPEMIPYLDAALDRLDTMASSHESQWRAVAYEYPRGLVLPEKVLIERDYTTVVATLRHATTTFDVPRHLGVKYIRRDIAPWVAHAGHVVTRSGMKYKALSDHRMKIANALVVTGKGPFVIQEGKPFRGKKVFESKVTPRESCQQLRGELRFVRADKTMPLRASFVPKTASGGGK